VACSPTDDHRLELDDGRTVGYATWGDSEGTPVFFGHGTPGSRLDRYPSLDDPEWPRQRRLRFIGVDRPGYGYSDPWHEAGLLDCAGDFVRVADDLDLERFWALSGSGGGPYALALGALAPERLRGLAIVSFAEIGMDEGESPEELAMALGEEARALREDPEETFAAFFSAELPEADRRMLGRKDVRALLIETFQEGVRQGATGWVDDNLRQVRPWPFRLDEIRVGVRFHHGEADVLAPPDNAKELAGGIRGSRFHLYPGEGHIPMDRHIKVIVQTLLAT